MERVRNRPRYEVNYTVIPKSELYDLADMVHSDPSHTHQQEHDERERLKSLSEARVKEWPNTIEALRLRKEQDRKERMEREERARRILDDEEADYQATQRKAAIERANLILYEQDDRIKNFNSKMFLSHVLEERTRQLDVAEKKKQMVKDQEARWNVMMNQQLKRAKEEETLKQEHMRGKASQVQRMQRDQLGDVFRRKERERSEDRLEGDTIRAAAERAIIEEMEEENLKKQRAREMAKEYNKANLEIERLKAEGARREEQEDLKIQKFAQLKEEQMMERKRRADEKFRRDMDRRQRMIQRQSEYLASLRDAHEERIQRQMDEVQVEQENQDVRAKDKKARMWAEIEQSRRRQLDMKKHRKHTEDAERTQFRDQWASTAEQLLIEEMESRQGSREKNKRLLQFQKMQAREKSQKKKWEKDAEAVEGTMMRDAMKEEEEMFQKYVDTVMNEYAAKGRDLGTMRHVRKRGEAV